MLAAETVAASGGMAVIKPQLDQLLLLSLANCYMCPQKRVPSSDLVFQGAAAVVGPFK